MSDLSIPGVGTSKYGSDKLIEGLMKLERIPRDREEKNLKSLQDQRSVWLDFNRRLTTLRDSADTLYSYRNPFNDRLAKSSDESSLTATATREALEQTRSIVVKRIASADRFLSSELPKDYRVPAGTYTFTVGDKSLDLRFQGGSLQEFADALTRKGKDLLRAEVIVVKPDTKSLVIESLKTGAANRLELRKRCRGFRPRCRTDHENPYIAAELRSHGAPKLDDSRRSRPREGGRGAGRAGTRSGDEDAVDRGGQRPR